MKAEKIISILILVVILCLGSLAVYSAILDIQNNDNEETPIIITIDDNTEPTETNSCPILESIDDVVITVGDKLTILAYATDNDEDTLTYSFSNLPDSEVDKNKFEWQTFEEDDGEYEISVTVSDGECEATETLTIYVEADSEEDNSEDDDPNDNGQEEPDFEVDNVFFNGFSEDFSTISFNIEITNNGIDYSGDIEIDAEVTIEDATFSETFGPETGIIQDLEEDHNKIVTIEIPIDETLQLTPLITTIELYVEIDPSNDIDEEDENNNDYTYNTVVPEEPVEPTEADSIDLTVTDIAFVRFDQNYEGINFLVEITNLGEDNFTGDISTSASVVFTNENLHTIMAFNTDELTTTINAGESIQTSINLETSGLNQMEGIVDMQFDFMVDLWNTIEEIDETNNVGTYTETYEEDLFITLPDLTVENIQLINFGNDGETATFTADITNQGGDLNSEFEIYAHITMVDEADTVIFNFTSQTFTENLANGESSTVNFEIYTPGTLDTYATVDTTIEVNVDYTAQIEESDETNNLGTHFETLPDTYFQDYLNLADLEISRIEFIEFSEDGREMTFEVDISNTGEQEITTQFDIYAELVLEDDGGDFDYEALLTTINSLDIGEIDTLTMIFPVEYVINAQGNLVSGLSVYADFSEQIEESDETNNFANQIETHIIEYDLQVNGLFLLNGQSNPMEIVVSINYNTQIHLENVELDLFLEFPNGEQDTITVTLPTLDNGEFIPGNTIELIEIDLNNYYQTLPTSLTFDATATIDPNNEFAETNETNNEFTQTIVWE